MILKRGADIDRFLKKPDGAIRAVLIFGPEAGLVRERSQILAGAVTERPDDPFDVALIGEGEMGDGARLEAELMAISMMGGRRLVRLRLSGDDTGAEAKAASALERHLAGAFNPEAFLLIEAGNLKAGALRRAAEKSSVSAAIACYEEEPGDVARLVREALAAERVGLKGEALELFVGRMPHDRGVVRREIERLALFLGPGSDRVADAGDLSDFFGVEPEASLAQAALEAFGGRTAQACANLRRAALEGESGPAAVRAMGVHLNRLRRVVTLHQAGASLPEAAKSAGVFWKSEREYLRQARTWKLADLDRIQGALLQADRSCKQARAPSDLLAERVALVVAGQARRLGL